MGPASGGVRWPGSTKSRQIYIECRCTRPSSTCSSNHFLIKDDEPLLFHTGMRRMFPEVRDAVATLIDPAVLRWIGWSHFEVDECGALNEWLPWPARAGICSQVGAAVNIEDFASRPPRASRRTT